MTETYFQRLGRLSENRFWVNNPTPVQAREAVAAGAVACTTNPTYGWKQSQNDETRAELDALITELIASEDDDQLVVDAVQQKCVARILPFFEPEYRRSSGRLGFVSIQGNPFRDDDANWIETEARHYLGLGANVIAKIPVTRAGLTAIERLVADGVPVIATEVMSLSQAIVTCEVYRKASEASGKQPPFFLTHITGIFDDYLQNYIAVNKIDIDPDIAWQAGIILARRQYMTLKRLGYGDIIMLGGGARGTHHFTELMGSNAHVTINWQPTATDLIAANPPILYRMECPSPAFMVDELSEKCPDFRTAYEEGGLSVEEFEAFSPVKLFRSMFCDGWGNLADEVRTRRSRA
jgi:transaldolase